MFENPQKNLCLSFYRLYSVFLLTTYSWLFCDVPDIGIRMFFELKKFDFNLTKTLVFINGHVCLYSLQSGGSTITSLPYMTRHPKEYVFRGMV